MIRGQVENTTAEAKLLRATASRQCSLSRSKKSSILSKWYVAREISNLCSANKNSGNGSTWEFKDLHTLFLMTTRLCLFDAYEPPHTLAYYQHVFVRLHPYNFSTAFKVALLGVQAHHTWAIWSNTIFPLLDWLKPPLSASISEQDSDNKYGDETGSGQLRCTAAKHSRLGGLVAFLWEKSWMSDGLVICFFFLLQTTAMNGPKSSIL